MGGLVGASAIFNDMSERNIFSMTSGGRGHTFNWVSSVMYENCIRAYNKRYVMHIHYCVFAKTGQRVSKKAQAVYEEP